MKITINLFLTVKWRAFGITFGKTQFHKRVEVEPATGKFYVAEGGFNVPADAWTLFNDRGVKLAAWL